MLLGAKGVDLNSKLAELRSNLTQNGTKTSEESSEGAIGFSVTLPGRTTPTILLSTKEQLVIGQRKELLAALLKGNLGGIQKIKATPQFVKATSTLPTTGQFFAAYVDVLPFLKLYENELKRAAANQGIVDQGSVDVNNVPLDAFAFSRAMTDTLADAMTFAVTAKNDEQKKQFDALETPLGVTLADKVPADLAIFLSADGRPILQAKDAALKKNPFPAGSVPPLVKLIDSIQSLGFGLRNASAASAFPELIIEVRTSQAEAFKQAIKDSVSGALASNQAAMPGMNWMSKDAAGSKVEYVTSPFGVGAFLSTTSDLLLIASSEQALHDTLAVAKGKAPSLMDSLPKQAKEAQKSKPGLAFIYSDFPRVAAVIETVQGNLAMFTGGRSAVDPGQTATLREMGTVEASVRYKDGLFKVESSYVPPKETGGK